jgi:hypothetical protein
MDILFKNDKQLAIIAIEQNPMALGFIGPTINKDKSLVMQAVIKLPEAI